MTLPLEEERTFEDADAFFKWARANDPKRYNEVAQRHPINGWRSEYRHEHGETYRPKEERGPLSAAARARYLEQQEVREQYHHDYALDARFVKELAAEGMRGY